MSEIQQPESVALTLFMGEKPVDARIILTPTGVEIEGQLSFEEWQRAVFTWKKIFEAFHVGFSDIVSYGRKEFGDAKVDETLEAFHFDMSDILKCYAIGQLPLDLRNESLTGEHYYILAKGLPNATKEQGRWAALALKEHLTPIELKRSIEKGAVVKQKDIERESGQNSGIPNIEGLAMTFQRWMKQAGGEQKILEQPAEWKEHFLQEVDPILALAEKIEATLPNEPVKPVQEKTVAAA